MTCVVDGPGGTVQNDYLVTCCHNWKPGKITRGTTDLMKSGVTGYRSLERKRSRTELTVKTGGVNCFKSQCNLKKESRGKISFGNRVLVLVDETN